MNNNLIILEADKINLYDEGSSLNEPNYDLDTNELNWCLSVNDDMALQSILDKAGLSETYAEMNAACRQDPELAEPYIEMYLIVSAEKEIRIDPMIKVEGEIAEDGQGRTIMLDKVETEAALNAINGFLSEKENQTEYNSIDDYISDLNEMDYDDLE